MSAGHHHLFLPGRSVVHRLAPEIKILAAVGFAVAVAVTPRRAVLAFAVHAAIVASVAVATGLPVGRLARRLIVVAPFVVFALFVPFVAGGETVEVAGLELSREGLWGTWNVVAKAGLGASASILLASTTPVPAIIEGLGRLRVPAVLVAIVAFMFRYLDLIVEEFGRTRVAMTARGHDPRWLWQVKPLASSAGALFVRSYERGERVHGAMLARGFDGRMPELDRPTTAARSWAVGLTPAVIALCIGLGAVVVR